MLITDRPVIHNSGYKISTHEHVIDLQQTEINLRGGTKNSIAWQAGIGGNLNITDNCFLDISLRYFNYGKSTTNFVQHNTTLGDIRYIGTEIKGAIIATGLVYYF